MTSKRLLYFIPVEAHVEPIYRTLTRHQVLREIQKKVMNPEWRISGLHEFLYSASTLELQITDSNIANCVKIGCLKEGHQSPCVIRQT